MEFATYGIAIKGTASSAAAIPTAFHRVKCSFKMSLASRTVTTG